MSKITRIIFALSATCIAVPAFASSDYLLQLPPEKGEASTPVTIDSWSFGACNSGQCSSNSGAAIDSPRDSHTGMATGKTGNGAKPNRASWNLATGKGARTAGGTAAPVAGDVDGDGSPDLAFAVSQDAIYGLSFTFQKISVSYLAACASGHIDSATVSHGDEVYMVSSVSVVCTKGGGGAAAASYARSGVVRIDSTPARLSTNMTVAREAGAPAISEVVVTRQASAPAISESCSSTACDGVVTMTFTGGQMKHTKTGHVTLLK